jgi:hypothetical protein
LGIVPFGDRTSGDRVPGAFHHGHLNANDSYSGWNKMRRRVFISAGFSLTFKKKAG